MLQMCKVNATYVTYECRMNAGGENKEGSCGTPHGLCEGKKERGDLVLGSREHIHIITFFPNKYRCGEEEKNIELKELRTRRR